jgi:hypothetical protein
MSNTILNRNSSFFVDGFNVVFYIDLFLYNELFYRTSSGDELLQLLFHKSIPKGEKYFSSDVKDVSIIQKLSSKKNQNVLLDLIDKGRYKILGIEMPIENYVSFLYYDFLTNPTCPEYIQTTEFGNTLKLLTNDSNFNNLDIYIPFESDFIKSSIAEAFTGYNINKVSIISGNKSELLKTPKYDSYAFENVNDIDRYLYDKTSKRTEVLIPNYEYNLIEERTKIERLVEQVTYQRIKLDKSNKDYMDKKIYISVINVPL